MTEQEERAKKLYNRLRQFLKKTCSDKCMGCEADREEVLGIIEQALVEASNHKGNI